MIIYWQKRCTRFCRGWTGCSLAAVARAIMSAGAGGLFPAPPAPPPLHLAQHLAAGQASILIIIIIILRPDISTFAFANYEIISGIKIITKGDHTTPLVRTDKYFVSSSTCNPTACSHWLTQSQKEDDIYYLFIIG